MKKQMYRLLIFLVPAMLLLSCTKDKYSEKDALDAQQTIDLLVTVVDGSSSLTPVSGATVNIVVGDKIVTQTTNESGNTVFTKVSIGGNAVITASKTAYTSVLVNNVSTNPTSYRQKQVATLVTIYSKDAAKMVTFKGRLTYQGDLTNRKREVAAGLIVKARNSNLGSGVDQFFTDTTDANGNYSIAVPANSNSNSISLVYPEFTANQKLAFEQDNRSIAVGERSVLFSPNAGNSNYQIPSYPSALATVTIPTGTGTGFALGVKAERTALFNIFPNNGYSTCDLISGGAGYNGNINAFNVKFSFSQDKKGKRAKLHADIIGGKLTNITYDNNGATNYDAAPTLNLDTLAPTTKAIVNLYFETTYKLYIANKGTGYNNFPIVSVQTEKYSSNTRTNYYDGNINDNTNPQLSGYVNILSGYTTIDGGLIRNKSLTNGDTLLTALGEYSSAPTFAYENVASKKAVLSIKCNSNLGYADINATDSTISNIRIDDAGLGYAYNTFPTVNITTLGGWGTGAVAYATVNSSYSLNNILINIPGTKYVQNVNDFDRSGSTLPRYADCSYPTTGYTVKPGDIITQDVYYGTGSRLLNQNVGK